MKIPKLSVVIISYKQVKYITDAIESVLSQKTNYTYELILADDCSNDGTLDIMKEYQRKFPKLIRVLERKENLGGARNIKEACCSTKGEYITLLEGDDYWCDDNRIQLMVDFLEKNKDFYAVSHLQEGRNLKNEIQGYYPKCIRKDTIIDGVEDFVNNNKTFSSSASLYRNFFIDKEKLNIYIKLNQLDELIGDAQTNVLLCSLGKVFVMNKPMMVYRMRNNDGDSNFNSSNSVDKIQLRYMNIYSGIEKIYNYKYSMYKKIQNNFTVGIAYCLLKFKLYQIITFIKQCPSKYRIKNILLFPINIIKIVYNRYIKK